MHGKEKKHMEMSSPRTIQTSKTRIALLLIGGLAISITEQQVSDSISAKIEVLLLRMCLRDT